MTRFLSVAILLSTLCLYSGAVAAQSATFNDLGTIPSAYSSTPLTGWAINASGQAVGYASVRAYSQDPGHSRPWLYSNGTMTDLTLGGLDGNTVLQGMAYGINDSGTVVGYAVNSTLSNGTRAFVTSGGSMTDLDAYDLTIGQSRAYGVNASGTTIVGEGYYTSSHWHPFVYSYSGTYNPTSGVYSGGSWSYSDIDGVLGGDTGLNSTYTYGNATAINNAGTITGYAPSGAASNYSHAFVLTSSGTATDLGVLGPGGPNGVMNMSQAYAINANGDVAGYCTNNNQLIYEPFLAVNSGGNYTMTALTMPSTSDAAEATGVNKYDMVSGMGYLTASGNSSYDAFLWTTGVVPFYDPSSAQVRGLPIGVNDLNTLAASALPSGWVLNTAKGINDAGQIIGSATYNGSGYAYILSLPQALPGDANLDGKVDINDLTAVLSNYNQSVGMNWSTGDFTGSGTVDINDLTVVLAHYNESVSMASGGSFSAVPEPGSLLLLVLAAGLLAFARRKLQRQ